VADQTQVRVQELLANYGATDASVAHLLCDRHPADATAYTIVDADLSATTLTYGSLREGSERFAQALASLDVGVGDRVATLMGKNADYLVAAMGIWRLGAVQVPLFTAFAPRAIAARLLGSKTKVVVCDAGQRPKLDPSEDIPPDAPWRVVVSGGAAAGPDLDFHALVDQSEPGHPAAVLGGDAPIVHIYTSGTTGNPKGVVLPVRGLASLQIYMEYGYDLRDEDVFWCAADPGWAYGLYYAVIGAALMGAPSLLLNAGFDAELTWKVLAKYGVTNFAAAPTVYRALRASGAEPPPGLQLRCATSIGEPLTPDVNMWAPRALGIAVHDQFGQTEMGMLVNNHHHPSLRNELKEGSMGRCMPGWTVNVLETDRDEIAPPNEVGRIAVDRTASPLMWFKGYDGATTDKFSPDGRWYYTGDTASVDDDGLFHFTSRDDDLIIMAGYRIGPFEVESVLASHPAVIESAAIAVPDEIRGEVLEAHVVLRNNEAGTPELATELQNLVKTRLAAHAYPRNVIFVDELPKTPSGKIQRFVLRNRRREELAR
jgi:acetyl-CoA synthetase